MTIKHTCENGRAKKFKKLGDWGLLAIIFPVVLVTRNKLSKVHNLVYRIKNFAVQEMTNNLSSFILHFGFSPLNRPTEFVTPTQTFFVGNFSLEFFGSVENEINDCQPTDTVKTDRYVDN